MKTSRKSPHRTGSKWLVVASLCIALLCSAASAAFPGMLATALQACGILLPTATGLYLVGFKFLKARAFKQSATTRILVSSFMLSALASAALASVSSGDAYSFIFSGGLVLTLATAAGIWSLEENHLWTALRVYCFLSTSVSTVIWVLNRAPGERYGAFTHPNYWGLLCFGNFCLAGLQSKYALRIPLQIANLLIILDAEARSSLLAVIAATLLLLYFSVQNWRPGNKRLLGLALVVLCFLVGGIFREQTSEVFSGAFKLDDRQRGVGTGFTGRSEVWEQGMATFESHPLLGVGPRMEANYISGVGYAHSGYISTLDQFGAIGAILFFGLAINRSCKLWKAAKAGRQGASVAFAFVIGEAINAVFDPKLINIGNPVSILLFAFLFLPTPKSRRFVIQPRNKAVSAQGISSWTGTMGRSVRGSHRNEETAATS